MVNQLSNLCNNTLIKCDVVLILCCCNFAVLGKASKAQLLCAVWNIAHLQSYKVMLLNHAVSALNPAISGFWYGDIERFVGL